MEKIDATKLDDQKSEPLGDPGDGERGVPDGEQGISNRWGDRADGDDHDELEEDFDELDESTDGAVGPKQEE